MVLILPLMSNSSSPFSKFLGTIGTILTIMYHSFFSSLARSKYLSIFSFSSIFTLSSGGTVKSVIYQMTGIFGSFLVTPCALASCHTLISKQEDDSTIRPVGYNRCVTGRRPRDENYAVRFRLSGKNRSRASDTQPIRGVSDELARGCKRWHPLAHGRRYGKKEVLSLSIYVSPLIFHTLQKHQPFRE